MSTRHKTLLLCLPSLLLLAAWGWFYHHPLLIWATGYSKPYWFQPLKQNPWPTTWPASVSPAEEARFNVLNLDGDRLFVESGGFYNFFPSAPPGSFIIAALPDGIGLAWAGPFPLFRMNGPHVIPYAVLALAGLVLPFGRRILRTIIARHRTRRGLCPACGYDLTGNVSGRCPECGRPNRLAFQQLRRGVRLEEDLRKLIDEGRH